jgi:hypothetical protein
MGKIKQKVDRGVEEIVTDAYHELKMYTGRDYSYEQLGFISDLICNALNSNMSTTCR